MRISIRMIGIATTVFWVFLIAFAVSAVYSVKDVQFDFGEPQSYLDSDNNMVFSLPVVIFNRGYYNIGFFNVTTEISDEVGGVISQGTTFIPVIRKGEETTILHNITIDVTDLIGENQNFLFNDTDLRMYGAVGMRLAEMIPVQASMNFSMPWGAPLYGFALGTPQYSPFNATHSRVSVPINFENHAFFDLAGDIQLSMFNSADQLIGGGQTAVAAYQNSPYSGIVDIYVLTTGVTDSGHFDVSFSAPPFNCGPWAISYG